ncbi:glycosyl transferase family protein [Methylomonas methanica]|uniref:Glycosyl transferase, family 3 n=1 Tax=Methylomonas methanica (strain DSM 25384 / MC09) TaxID=857087 RepID=G0A160_METMM|nr:glycosyl transferase family protein [Methylomonas methanica]AEG02480.1 Glycosyl transferase, family 3 [Methylomonas methanica MC09]
MSLTEPEHPFAEFIKILGKGKKGSRPLTQDEAYRAMKMILAGEVQPIQLGAFLMLMRVKEETCEELAGFVSAAKESFSHAPAVSVDLDWSSYAGKRRHLPWFLLSTFLLAENGIKVFMHGAGGHTQGRVYTEKVLEALGIPAAHSLAEAEQQLLANNFSYLSLRHICPMLFDMINLRPVMGLRSPVHTLVRLLNPMRASHSIQGIFHPSYRQVHQKAALLLGERNMAVLKGEGGETERNPDVECLVQSVCNGELTDEPWPALFARRHMKADELDPRQLAALWQGHWEDEFAEATVIGTAAVALKLLGRADTQDAAHNLAQDFWLNRNRDRLSGG